MDEQLKQQGMLQAPLAEAPNQLPGQSSCRDIKAEVEKVNLAAEFLEMLQQMKPEALNLNGANNETVLPISTKDLPNTLPEKARNLKAFLRFIRWSVINFPPEHHAAVLLPCVGFLGYQATSTAFDLQQGVSSNAPRSLLSFGQAFSQFLPEMAHITKFMLCYFLTLLLVWPLKSGVQIFLMLLLITAPLHYFADLARKVSGIRVACGSFKLPLMWFATFGALGLSLICGLLTLLMVYFSWGHMYERGPDTKELNDLEEMIIEG